MCETGTGEQVAQLHDSLMMIMIMMMMDDGGGGDNGDQDLMYMVVNVHCP